jgi:hypothetical protein
VRSWGSRYQIIPTANTTATTMKPRNHGPIVLLEKEWIDVTTPERVRKVPKSERQNARLTSVTFHTRSIPRFSWIITECRNAVAASHGISAAFSTGSHA